MVKVASSDVVAILRRFDVANDTHVPRHIEHITISHPSAINTLVSFRFLKNSYYILFDDTAEDEVSYIESQIRTAAPEVEGALLENPNDHITTYGLPYHGKDVYVFRVAPKGVRLDTELARRYPDTSRSTWQKHIKAGHVQINKKVVTSPKQLVQEAQAIEVTIPEKESHEAETLPIIYSDDNVIVINKPHGILTHSKGALNDEFTVADFFRRYTTYNTDTNRPGIVHRLDRDTSGVMIGARNEATAKLLQEQFSERTVKKSYVAVVQGVLAQPELTIDVPIGRNPSLPSTFRADPNGKSAQTYVRVKKQSDQHALVVLQPRTGRTHQLRVHMNYIGHTILGDRVYGTEADRLYLHAESLEITIPSGDRKVFTVPMPAEFEEAI